VADDEAGGTHYFALPTGSRLHEFEIEGVLGHGGFGITYRAHDTLLQETVAIKEFLPNELAIRVSDASVRAKSNREQFDFGIGLKSFLEEARVMARFRHPRIVHVRRFFELHGTGYIVLDYEAGITLSERLSEGPIPEREIRDILSGLLDGLEVVHARAILHRDLKPSNVMLREDGAPVIIDFGAARDFQTRHSRSITAIATAGYAPPEQYGVGDRQQGPWSDLYALGAIAYRVVSGVPPADSLRRLRNDPLIPAVVTGAGKYDETLLRTIDWMLKIDEEQRPVSVAQVRKALRGQGFGRAMSPMLAAQIAYPGDRDGRPVRADSRSVHNDQFWRTICGDDPGSETSHFNSKHRTTAAPANVDLISGKLPAASRRTKSIAAAAGLILLTLFSFGVISFFKYEEKQPDRQQMGQPADGQSRLARNVPESTTNPMVDKISGEAPRPSVRKITTVAVRERQGNNASPTSLSGNQQWLNEIARQTALEPHLTKTLSIRGDSATGARPD
jgi:serine/threonine protein kinase